MTNRNATARGLPDSSSGVPSAGDALLTLRTLRSDRTRWTFDAWNGRARAAARGRLVLIGQQRQGDRSNAKKKITLVILQAEEAHRTATATQTCRNDQCGNPP